MTQNFFGAAKTVILRFYDDVEAGNYGFPGNDESRQNISSEKGSRSFYGRATERGRDLWGGVLENKGWNSDHLTKSLHKKT